MTGPMPMDNEWEPAYSGAPEKWEAKVVGDSLVGTYTGFENIPLEDHPQLGKDHFTLYFVTQDDGKVRSIGNSVQIEKCFSQVEVGDYIKLTFIGNVEVGQPAPMRNYSIMRRKTSA